MVYLNQTLWKSAYLLEFKQNNMVTDAFTFSVPPQSEEFSFPQRINETKTFGGSVFEDYGNDTVQISLSGTTINQQVKYIYRSKFPAKLLTGEEEIFYLKDLLEKYGKFDRLKNKKEVYLYRLESAAVRAQKSGLCWQIWVQELTIKRSKDNPFAYNYTLKALGVPIEKLSAKKDAEGFLKRMNDWTDTVNGWTEKLRETLDSFKKVVETFWKDNILSYISAAKEFAVSINNLCDTLTAYVTETGELANNLLMDTFKETDALEKEIARTVTLPLSVMTQIYNTSTELVTTVSKIKSWSKEITKSDTNQWKQAKAYYDVSEQDLKDAFFGLIGEIEDEADALVVQAKKEISEHNEFPVIVPGSDGEADSVVIAHGSKEYTYTSGDTWASIAQSLYGDASYATLLQLYNKDLELSSIKPGDTVYCPVVVDTSSYNSENEVYGELGSHDAYGKDIGIQDSDFAIRNGDFALTSGNSTVNQAISNRLRTALNSRVRNVVYGIRNDTGLAADGKAAASSYISASIRQTILADPRVETVESLVWNGTGESLSVEVVYTTIGGEKQTYTGVV